MADISQVEQALVNLFSSIVCPSGALAPAQTIQPANSKSAPLLLPPGLLSDIPGQNGIRVYKGWPNSAPLNADLQAGILTASVFSPPGHSRLTTRYPRDWYPAATQTPLTLSVAQTLTQATFSGAPALGQLVGVRLSKVLYSYAVTATDTLATIASALAALVPGTTASGATLTVPTAPDFLVRLGQMQTLQRELRRQQQVVQATLWCPTPETRAALASLIDGAMSDIEFLTLPDGTFAWIKYSSTAQDDVIAKTGLWKRTLSYLVEYPTMQTMVSAPLLFATINTNENNGPEEVTII